MSEETARLTLAFVGDQEVHRNNARSLLEDFVDGWLKQHRKGEVVVILPEWDNPTDTMSDLDDWASTAGHDVNYIGVGDIITRLLEVSDARLILVGDPNDDEALYDVAEEAAKYRIQTRSLINGLEKVVFDDDDFEDDMSGEGFHEVDVETDEGWADEDLTDEAAALLAAVPDVPDVPEEDAAPDLDLLAALADDGTVEAQEEIKDVAAVFDIDVAPFETWADAVAAIHAKNLEQFAAQVPEPAESVEEIVAAFDAGEKGITAPPELKGEDLQDAKDEETDLGADLDEEKLDMYPGKTYTREELEAATFDEVKAIGVEIGLVPGRGYKKTVYVNKILQMTGVETEAPKRKRNRGKAKLEAVAEPVAGEATEAKDSDNTHGSNIIPIHEVVQGHSLKEIADSLRHYADVLDPPEN